MPQCPLPRSNASRKVMAPFIRKFSLKSAPQRGQYFLWNKNIFKPKQEYLSVVWSILRLHSYLIIQFWPNSSHIKPFTSKMTCYYFATNLLFSIEVLQSYLDYPLLDYPGTSIIHSFLNQNLLPPTFSSEFWGFFKAFFM